MNEGSKGTGLGTAEDRLKVCSAASGYVGDNGGNVIIGTGATRAKTLQPGINGGNDRVAGPLQKDLKKAVGIKALGFRVGSDGNDGVLALGRNVAACDIIVRPLLKVTLCMVDGRT